MRRTADADAPFGRIRKVGTVDKKRVERWLPMADEVRRALDRVPVLAGYLFPSPKSADKPWTRYHARDLLERAEKLAGLEALDGGDFHPYRRKWATERKHLPVQDVMYVGDWLDVRSLQAFYQQVDAETLYAVVTEPRKLRKKALADLNNTVHNTVHGRHPAGGREVRCRLLADLGARGESRTHTGVSLPCRTRMALHAAASRLVSV